jgi:CRP/FNR family transcriptional regulator, cyclic AMP receptor protein
MRPTMRIKNDCIVTSRKILAATGTGTKVMAFPEDQTIFTQGDAVGTVFYIQEGRVKLTVVSKFGKKTTLGIFGAGEFFGEGGLAGQSMRTASATSMSACKLLRIADNEMVIALRRERELSDLFIMQMLTRNIRYHEALVDQLFDRSEIRLARVLLRLALWGKEGTATSVIAEVSEESLASMAGTDQPHVNSLMKHFRESGFLAYSKSGLQVHTSLLGFVLLG